MAIRQKPTLRLGCLRRADPRRAVELCSLIVIVLFLYRVFLSKATAFILSIWPGLMVSCKDKMHQSQQRQTTLPQRKQQTDRLISQIPRAPPAFVHAQEAGIRQFPACRVLLSPLSRIFGTAKGI